MAYTVKEADVLKDKQIMLRILQNNRTRQDYDYNKRYDWIYLNNPLGKAKAWIIWKDKTNEAVGFTGVFPRAVYVNGKKYIGWNCGDFSIEKKFRSLGIALKLRKAAKQGVDSNEVPFLYAHPNSRMEVIHLKSGHFKIAQMVRYALPVRLDAILARFIPFKWLMRMFAIPLNVLLSYQYRFRIFSGVTAKIFSTVQLNENHENLFTKMTEQFPVLGSRDNAYLNWKYRNNPNYHFQQMDLFYKGLLVGSIFYIKQDKVISVSDVLIDDFHRFSDQLFRYFVKKIRREYPDIVSVSFILQEFNPFIPVLKKTGFKYRDDATSGVISYVNEENNPELAKQLLNGKNWFMTVGDRDA